MKFEFIDDWKKAYTLYSMWFFVLLGMAPDIFNLAVSMNVIDSASAPAILSRLINLIAFLGAVTRLLKQKKEELDQAKPVVA